MLLVREGMLDRWLRVMKGFVCQFVLWFSWIKEMNLLNWEKRREVFWILVVQSKYGTGSIGCPLQQPGGGLSVLHTQIQQ
jgi:hypothetical protein